MKNKMGLSVGIAVGSSLQIALFVAPVLVFFSYLFGQPMDLEFTLPEVVAVIVAVHLIFQMTSRAAWPDRGLSRSRASRSSRLR